MSVFDVIKNQSALQWEWLLRIFIACILGVGIGYERKNRNKMAGTRTHAMVALASALIMVISKYGFSDIGSYDASRVAAQVVSGVGFLGAGIIFVRNNNSVSGLTTAAGIWATSAVGMSMGAGLYFIGVTCAVLMIAVQVLMHRISFLAKEALQTNMRILVKNSADIQNIEDYMKAERLDILTLKITKDELNTKLEMEVLFPPGYNKINFISKLAEDEDIVSIRG